jgi:hypothetical protein
VEGYPFPGFWTPALEAKRQAFNQWMRTSNAYDAVIDFDQVLRDPSQPSRCHQPTTAAITYIRTTTAIGRWRRPSTCRCSWILPKIDVWSVGRGPLDAVHDDDLDRPVLAQQSQPEMLAQRLHEREPV